MNKLEQVKHDMELLRFSADLLLLTCARYTHADKMNVVKRIARIRGVRVDSVIKQFEEHKKLLLTKV